MPDPFHIPLIHWGCGQDPAPLRCSPGSGEERLWWSLLVGRREVKVALLLEVVNIIP